MKALSGNEVLSATAKGLARWCMQVGVHDDNVEEVLKAAPWLLALGRPDLDFLVQDGGGVFSFESEDECRKAFLNTVGDDGPTASNPYDGPVKVYACVCAPDGRLMTENT